MLTIAINVVINFFAIITGLQLIEAKLKAS